MKKHLKSGTKKWAFRLSGFSVLARPITFGSMAPAPAAPALRFIMTAVRNMAAASRTVRLAVNATDIWRSGTMCSRSLITTETVTIPS